MSHTIHEELSRAIAKAYEAFRRELGELQGGRAQASLLERIRVNYYGVLTPLVQIVHLTIPEARTILIKPFDRSQIKGIEKAICEASLGLDHQVEADCIRVRIPPVTEQRRKELIKIVRKYGEECKISIRKARHDALNKLQQLQTDGVLSEDEAGRLKKKVEEKISDSNKEVDVIVVKKEKDILEV
ncbi:ribosome recycling factor [Pajaroellobacter abortibovis]|uniref:Ribosome-recycling factor n=1 Tax=Pajaroellobacter abortibovis TaxID=1882918 RepID=A0A1L6MZD9_9BACT|nr:ribosome recycling factor [Pajaroellobacter abortibovis]APS00892.1 ribosome recycling factor [Pajaroellobacter abortibovis]